MQGRRKLCGHTPPRHTLQTAKTNVKLADRKDTYVFAVDHPDLPRSDMTILWEISPSGQVVRPS